MGQYYYPINLDKKQYLYSHDYDNGLKLMEHSYINNEFVNAVCGLLIQGGQWFKDHIVWSGDYADPEKGHGKKNLHDLLISEDSSKDKNKITPKVKDLKGFNFLVNHTLKLFINLKKIKEFEKGWKIHPLPLLTCEGNGRGGGDFLGEDPRLGTWARHSISLEKTSPKDYEEIDGTFIEKK